jgi:hypothetical protein
MSSYLVLFTRHMLDTDNDATKQWLRKLGMEGRLVSIDSLDGPVSSSNGTAHDEYKGFAIINARDNAEINCILRDCPSLEFSDLGVYRMA